MYQAIQNDPPMQGLNIIPFASMAGGWLGPLLMFWLYVWGSLRPFAYPGGGLLPGGWFVLPVIVSLAFWWLLPRSYFNLHSFERHGRIYESLAVLLFSRFAHDGDLANRWERRSTPHYRVIRGRRAAADFIIRTEQSERGHLVLLALGVLSAAYALSLEWHGWAFYLSAGNVVVNIYPIMLQRYTRCRIRAVLDRSPASP